MTDVERAQLLAIRSLVEAMLIADQAPVPSAEPPAAPGLCPHSESVDIGSTWTVLKRMCLQCGQVFERVDSRNAAADQG